MGSRPGAMEGVVTATLPTPGFWAGRRVLVTGHTGFKGGWLCAWLQAMQAEVHGFSLDPPTEPNFFNVATVEPHLASHTIGDVRDFEALMRAVTRARPAVVFHLAAQPLVRHSYHEPIETYAVNVMGTAHVLEAVRRVGGVRAAVSVTTDKCYENIGLPIAYNETERLGGFDPYSSSKACAELVTASYRNSFLAGSGVAVATARAGNVVGGGDWAVDRLVPDILRAIDSGSELTIRAPASVRPWQHVLEPVRGYLLLAERLCENGAAFAEPWNFGPRDRDARPVEDIVQYVASRTARLSWRGDASEQPHEADYLMLDSAKARDRLGWSPLWGLEEVLDRTLEWHEAWRRGDDMRQLTLAQIDLYAASSLEGSSAEI
jgi:CDP-glucose 4,6-dehydratase